MEKSRNFVLKSYGLIKSIPVAGKKGRGFLKKTNISCGFIDQEMVNKMKNIFPY